MKTKLFLLLSFSFCSSFIFAQCDLDFGSGASPLQFTFDTPSGSDIVNGGSSGANSTDSQSFDLWDETTDDCTTTGGVDDITFDFEIIHAFDQYTIDGVIDTYAGTTHDIVQSGTGLSGGIPMGNSSSNESSAGDVRGVKITVRFSNHWEISAGDLLVNLTSANTSGSTHESTSLIFLDASGNPYGTSTYDGYYTGSGPSTDGSCTVPAKRANSWSISATGAYTASSTTTADNTTPCDITAGSNGTNDNHDVSPVTDAGLNASDRIGGYVYTVYLEDIAATTAPGVKTTTSSRMTSTLNGISIASLQLPIELVEFKAKQLDNEVLINWSTASEENNDYFEIEWSNNGDNFQVIKKIAGKGTDFNLNQYQYMHSNPIIGKNYYRLKQTDYNNDFSYSDIRIVTIDQEIEVMVYPTIASNFLTILKPKVKSNISIYNTNGILLRQYEDNDNDQYEINVNNLSTGTYFVVIMLEGEIFHERFVKN